MKAGQFDIDWLDRGHPPRNPPDPRYPDGIDLDVSAGRSAKCKVALPYPTGHVNVGSWLVHCRTCGGSGLVTAASRADDPRSVTLPCKVYKNGG